LVSSKIDKPFKKALLKNLKIAWGKGPTNKVNQDFGGIINELHTKRLSKLLDGHGGQVLTGLESSEGIDASTKFIQPTIIENPDENS
jgi:acyl-CoA reductase-like NAD-dependent aldehyde dehydrogenase